MEKVLVAINPAVVRVEALMKLRLDFILEYKKKTKTSYCLHLKDEAMD